MFVDKVLRGLLEDQLARELASGGESRGCFVHKCCLYAYYE
jgi:hypothetical protein